ncbi:MAG: 50S ribosomal protein L9 [Candidatus Vogelbacteria bacterium]|nr:50S ribosomal protein L9 [Candidatus Vogelbacteria bacterium]
MQVILLQDVPKVGRKYELKNVADGFGRNFLIARGKATLADAAGRARIARLQAENSLHQEMEEKLLQSLIKTLTQETTVIKAKANNEGHLFAGLKAKDLAKEINQIHHTNITPSLIMIKKPIKSLGEYQIKIEQGRVRGDFTIRIEKAE